MQLLSVVPEVDFVQPVLEQAGEQVNEVAALAIACKARLMSIRQQSAMGRNWVTVFCVLAMVEVCTR